MPKLFEGMVLTKEARLEEGEEERWKPVLMAALTIRSLRHVRWGSSAVVEVTGLMIVEVDDPVRPEDWE